MKTAQEIMDLMEAVVDLDEIDLTTLLKEFTYEAVQRKIISIQSTLDDLDLLQVYYKYLDTL